MYTCAVNGKYSDKLSSVLRLYYNELFPNELSHLSQELREMLVLGGMEERDWPTMKRMVQDGDIQAGKAWMTMELIIALHQHFLYEAVLARKGFDAQAQEEKFNRMFEYLLSAGR